MPEMNGIETAAQLPPGTAIIFITAYDRYAIKAFELHAFDYILKPVMKDRLEEAIRRVRELRRGGATPVGCDCIRRAASANCAGEGPPKPPCRQKRTSIPSLTSSAPASPT
ncbi:MAG TPA: hypothetical protein DHU26_04660 [Spirochaetaceae bacterium]|nr:hypothetical protein [Spirochaetaceae bacterium]